MAKQKLPIYLQIKNKIEEMIDQGVLVSSGLVPSDRELAKKFETSLVTAQRAVNALAAEGKVRRIPRKGTVVTAKPGKFAVESNPTWAVLVPTMDYFYPPIIQVIENRARKLGVSIVLGCLGGDLKLEREMIDQKIAEGVSGIILAPVQPYGPTPADYTHPITVMRPEGSLDYLAELPVPVVVIDHFGMDMPNVGIDCVLKDDFAGGYQSISYLVQNGYRKISVFSGMAPGQTSQAYGSAQRHKGYLEAIKDYGLELPDLQELMVWNIDHDTAPIKQHIDAGVEAFVFGDDSTAAIFIRLLEEWNLKVPDDIAVMGFDDDRICQLTNPMITSVRIPKDDMACKAVDILAERIKSGSKGNCRTVVYKPMVISRESCRNLNTDTGKTLSNADKSRSLQSA